MLSSCVTRLLVPNFVASTPVACAARISSERALGLSAPVWSWVHAWPFCCSQVIAPCASESRPWWASAMTAHEVAA
ncbi:hypothetical protein [Streptacidiphilus rugosus]|uniref:hypothetical protein n=1 Tax=Streptacidiphilus rugosus TaxID=405783 RepID=UPI00055F9229|nr:hypothetical protein [Streptacidiphilus rugosus]